MNNYKTAQQVLNNRSSRKIGNNTYLKRLDDNTIGVLLHDTYVVTYKPDRVILDSGGWRTSTTKDRINKYSPLSIYQKNNLWFFDLDNSLFYDGVEITEKKVINPKQSEKTVKTVNKTKAKIKKYIDKAIKTVKSGMDLPSGGDCWFCVMQTQDGQSLGDTFKDNDHISQHLKEGYIVPALLWNAVKEKGYRYPQIILGYEPETKKTNPKTMIEFGIRSSLRSYLNKRLIRL